MISGMDGISLPPELERFAADEVAAGRYRDTAEVVRAGVNLLKQRSQARAELLASVLAAQEEGDRLGYLTGDELLARVETRLARRASAGE
jgi:putative addiction module CopG family antidote